MDWELRGKRGVVTGGAKGTGAAIIRAAADEAAHTVVIDRDENAARKLESELHGCRKQTLARVVKLTNAESCRQAVEQATRSTGEIDALINNAGVNDRVGLEGGSPAEYVASLARNLLHYYNVAHYALPWLKKTHGTIVNISSKTAITGQGGTSGYASSKGAILALTREWAVELLAYGIRVNAVVPAEVMTPLYRQWLSSFPDPEEKLENIVSKIPLGQRMTTPEEIAAAVLFLISSKASHITGHHIFVDGGYAHLDRALS